MAKKKTAEIKVQVVGGQATPAPPVGTALGPHGVNIGQFVQGFNEKTRELNGTIVPVVITIFNDRSHKLENDAARRRVRSSGAGLSRP